MRVKRVPENLALCFSFLPAPLPMRPRRIPFGTTRSGLKKPAEWYNAGPCHLKPHCPAKWSFTAIKQLATDLKINKHNPYGLQILQRLFSSPAFPRTIPVSTRIIWWQLPMHRVRFKNDANCGSPRSVQPLVLHQLPGLSENSSGLG